MQNIFWTAYSKNDRHTTLEDLKTLINTHGDIVDFKFFSDLSAVLTIEIQERRINSLYDSLQQLIITEPFTLLNAEAERERTIYLNISFSQATGDLRVQTPEVPG